MTSLCQYLVRRTVSLQMMLLLPVNIPRDSHCKRMIIICEMAVDLASQRTGSPVTSGRVCSLSRQHREQVYSHVLKACVSA